MAVEKEHPDLQDAGYGKAPKAHQFKPGQSGNPKGRPKGPGKIMKLIEKHAAKKVTVVEGGVQKKMAKMDVVISAMFNAAAKGDVSAARLLTTLILAAEKVSGDHYQSGYSAADFQVILNEADWQAKLVELKNQKAQHEY